MGYFVGSDVGGTFTDIWVLGDDGEPRVFKSPTTGDVLTGVLDAMRIAAEAYGLSFEDFCSGIDRFGHGTTVGLNALLTGRAARTAIVTTAGFEDTLEIGRLRRQTSGLNEVEATDPYLRNRFPPLVPRRLIFGVDERVDATGHEVSPLDEASAKAAIDAIAAAGVEAVAVCTLFSTLFPTHEQRLRQLINAAMPDVFVSLSHEVAPAIGEYGRMSTTAANAALGPIAGRYLSRLEETLRDAGMQVPVMMMTCAGGVLPTEILNDRPAIAIFSGPSAGVIGSQAIGAQIGVDNVLTTDIGGTSFDVGAIVAGKPIMRAEIAVAGADVRVHSIDVDSIGAGGGSIASVTHGELHVGPASAGANPGPACYGRGGTEPTATDADLVLGVLDPDNFIGGRMQLDVAAAKKAIEDKVAKPLGIGLAEAAWGIRHVLDSRMADLLRRMTVERGYNPRDFTLLANGGAGPSHAWVLARELGLDRFVVPAAATAESAYGTANSDLGFTAERPSYIRIPPRGEPTAEQLARVAEALKSAETEVQTTLAKAGPRATIAIELLAAIRFRGQTHSLDIPVANTDFDLAAFKGAASHFETEYETLFGRGAAFASAGYELLSVRAVGTAALPPPATRAKGEQLTRHGSRKLVFDDPATAVDTAIYTVTFPAADVAVDGPAVIEFPGQSVVVPPGARATADTHGNLHVRWPS